MSQRFLLLDDTPGEGAALRLQLTRIPALRCEVVQPDSIEEGMDELERNGADAVFVTDELRSHDPVALVEDIREKSPRPIVILSASKDGALAVRLIQAGADDWIVKTSLNPVRLQAILERAEREAIQRRVSRSVRTKNARLSGLLERESLAMRRLELAMEKVEAANRAKTTFLANVTHEIRTPLTAILGWAEELQQDELPAEERRSAAATIRHNGEHLLRMVNDLLDLSRVDAGALQIEILEMDPTSTTQEVCDTLRGAAVEAGISLVCDVAEDTPRNVLSDPTRIRQILMNLVGNAIKFTDEGSVRVEVAPRGEEIEFRIVDTGIGIGDDELRRIFQPFEQADSSISRRFGGTGLGLAICERLVQALGGSIDARSEPGKGSTFRFTIPKNEGSGSPNASMEGPSSMGSPLPPRRILFADDNAVNRQLVMRVLTRAGACVETVSSGGDAVRAFAEARGTDDAFDLVLLDLRMPVVDGFEAARQIRARDWDGPIVAFTGDATEEERARCREAGFDGFTTKPMRRVELLTTLRDLLERGPART